jgi:DNA-binding NtrC family response regulator
MVQGFARQSGGEVQLDSVPERGTTIRLWLPRSTAPVTAPAPSAIPPVERADTPRSHRVLVVDDEAIIRQTLVAILSRAGYRPEAAASGQEALEHIRSGEPWDLLITDQSMPGMTGIQLIQHVAAINPTLPTMLMTGFDKVSGLDEHPEEFVVLYKPFDRAALLDHVKALAGAPPGTDEAGKGLARVTEGRDS